MKKPDSDFGDLSESGFCMSSFHLIDDVLQFSGIFSYLGQIGCICRKRPLHYTTFNIRLKNAANLMIQIRIQPTNFIKRGFRINQILTNQPYVLFVAQLYTTLENLRFFMKSLAENGDIGTIQMIAMVQIDMCRYQISAWTLCTKEIAFCKLFQSGALHRNYG